MLKNETKVDDDEGRRRDCRRRCKLGIVSKEEDHIRMQKYLVRCGKLDDEDGTPMIWAFSALLSVFFDNNNGIEMGSFRRKKEVTGATEAPSSSRKIERILIGICNASKKVSLSVYNLPSFEMLGLMHFYAKKKITPENAFIK